MPNSSTKAMILTGGSGTLGTELRHIGADNGCIFISPTSKECNILIYRDVLRTLSKYQCDTVVHAAAATDVPGLEKDLITAFEINVVGTFNILKACIELDKHLVYISTDYVFDGSSGPYKTSDALSPLSVYAKSKASAELMVRAYDNSTVIRTSFFGHEFPHKAAFVDQWSSKDYVDEIAPKIIKCLKSGERGVFHVGSRRRTIYEIAKIRTPDVDKISRTTIKHQVPEDTSLVLSDF